MRENKKIAVLEKTGKSKEEDEMEGIKKWRVRLRRDRKMIFNACCLLAAGVRQCT